MAKIAPLGFLLLLNVHHIHGDTPDLTQHPGHLKAFGESGQVVDVDFVHEYPHPDEFLDENVMGSKPLVMKNVAKQSPAFHLWTDAYLKEKAAKNKDAPNLIVEKGKKEIRGNEYDMLSLPELLERYNTSDIYLVHSTPQYLLSDVHLPCPLQRPGLIETVYRVLMWMSSGGTISVLHIDASDNILCVFRGKKTVILMDRYKRQKMFKLEKTGFVKMDVDKVDLTEFPTLAGAKFYKAELNEGDCLFIPYLWPHQVRSYGSNLAVNIWWNHDEAELFHDLDLGKDDNLTCDPDLSLEGAEYVSE